jgi:hypothetical protein
MEGAIVATFGYMVLAQQDQLANLSEELAAQLHLYMVCVRPRIGVVPDEFSVDAEKCRMVFTSQHGQEFRRFDVEVPNYLGRLDVTMQSVWPYGDFQIVASDGQVLTSGRTSLLLSSVGFHHDDLDLEVLYIGQAYGADGDRSATERLLSHSTLQGIYSEAVRRSPDQEVYLALLSLDEPYGLIAFSPVPSGPDDNVAEDFHRLTSPISEQQRLNFTEAALIKYFAPPYNKDYKESFPSAAHTTYSECYDLDLNAVAFEFETSEVFRTRLYSKAVHRSWVHVASFELHSPADRRSMFDFAPD